MKILLDVSEYQSPAQLDALLHGAPDEIVGVYIKATQDVTYRNQLAGALAQVCQQHKTPFGYYDFLTNAQAADQAGYFYDFIATLPAPSLRPMLDCEGTYNKWAAGVRNWGAAREAKAVLYAQLSNMPRYTGLDIPLWVAQYDRMSYYRPGEDEIADYANQGYVAWQWTSAYLGQNQDASVLLGSLDALRV